jgi:hypothetical protein
VIDLFMRVFLADDSTGLGPWDEFLCKNAGEEGVLRCFDVTEGLDLEMGDYPLHPAGPGYSQADFVYDSSLDTLILSSEKYQAAYAKLRDPSLCGAGVGGTSCYDLIVREANQQGLPPEFAIAIAAIESAGDPKAKSVKNARGLMQVMPATGRELCGDVCKGMNDAQIAKWLENPSNNAKVGVKYLVQNINNKRVQQLAGGDPKKMMYYAAMAYNAGPGRLKSQAGCDGGVQAGCIKETRAYVKRMGEQLGW